MTLPEDSFEHKSLLKKIYIENCNYLAGLTKDTGAPLMLDEEALKKYTETNFLHQKNHYPFLVYNIKANKIMASGGFEMRLGWAANFDYFYFLEQVHPDYIFPFVKWAMTAYSLAYQKKIRNKLSPESHKYSVSLPLRDLKTSQYHWVAQESIPIQFDKERRLVSHVNRYTLLNLYSEYGQPPFDAIVFDDNSVDTAIMENFRGLIKQYLFAVFSTRQKEIIGIIVRKIQNREKITAETIANELDVTVEAVRHHYRCILPVGNRVVGARFNSTVEFIEYCLNRGYLPFD